MSWVRKVSVADMVTLGNALVGFLAITYVMDRAWLVASMLILLGVALDGLDGLAARRFGTKHNRGQYLDSFSDTISFCIAPALLVYGVFYSAARGSAWSDPLNALAVVASTLIASFGILRLARFVQQDFAKESFLGFPTPANALFVIALVDLFGAAPPDKLPALFDATWIILPLMIAAAVLMISNVPYPKIGDALRVPLTIGSIVFAAAAVIAYLALEKSITVEAVVFTLLLLTVVAYIFGGPLYVRRTRSADEVLPVQ